MESVSLTLQYLQAVLLSLWGKDFIQQLLPFLNEKLLMGIKNKLSIWGKSMTAKHIIELVFVAGGVFVRSQKLKQS